MKTFLLGMSYNIVGLFFGGLFMRQDTFLSMVLSAFYIFGVAVTGIGILVYTKKSSGE